MILLFNFGLSLPIWSAFLIGILLIAMIYFYSKFILENLIANTFTKWKKFRAVAYGIFILGLLMNLFIAFGAGERKGPDVPLDENSLTQSAIKETDSVPPAKVDKYLLQMTNDSIRDAAIQKRKIENANKIEELLNN